MQWDGLFTEINHQKKPFPIQYIKNLNLQPNQFLALHMTVFQGLILL